MGINARADQHVTLGWTADPATNLAGYTLHYGFASHQYTCSVDAGRNTSYTLTGLQPGSTYFFAVAARDQAGAQSPDSAEVSYVVPGVLLPAASAINSSAGFGLQFPVAAGNWYQVQASTDLRTWTNIYETTLSASNGWAGFVDQQKSSYPMRFYRLVLNTLAPAILPPLRIANKWTAANLGSGQFQLTAAALANVVYVLQWSTNLQNWTSLFTNRTGQSLNYVDTPPPGEACRFYRGVAILGAASATNINAAIAAGDFLGGAQGFARITAPPGYSLIGCPFSNANNTVATALPGMPPGALLVKYSAGQGYVTNAFRSGAWTMAGQTLNPGEGAYFVNPASTNLALTFLGTVPPSPQTNALAAGISLCSPAAPLPATLASLPAINGDVIKCYAKRSLTTYTYQAGKWVGRLGAPALSIQPGQGFLINRQEAGNWVESY